MKARVVALRCLSSASISVSMVVNCENSKILRPSATISGSNSISCSSLAEVLTFWAASSLTSEGSQHTWRSFSSASSTAICARASSVLARTFRS